MTPEQAAYRAGCIVSEAEHRFGGDGRFSPTLLSNLSDRPAHLPVLLRHVWPKVLKDATCAALLDGFDPPAGPLPVAAQGSFWVGYYHQMAARRLPPDFPAKLTALREAAGLSVARLAGQSHLSRQAVYDLEAGKYRPTWDVVQRLAAALHVPTDTFRDPVK